MAFLGSIGKALESLTGVTQLRQMERNAGAQRDSLAQQTQIAGNLQAERYRYMPQVYGGITGALNTAPAWVNSQYNAQKNAAQDAFRVGQGGLLQNLSRRGVVQSGMMGNAAAASQANLAKSLAQSRAGLEQQADQRYLSLLQMLASTVPNGTQAASIYGQSAGQYGQLAGQWQQAGEAALNNLMNLGKAIGSGGLDGVGNAVGGAASGAGNSIGNLFRSTGNGVTDTPSYYTPALNSNQQQAADFYYNGRR